MSKQRLTDRTLNALKPTAKPYDVMDSVVPGFGVRVMGTPEVPVRSFILFTRYPGSTNPARRTIAPYPAIALEQARKIAQEWRNLIKQGKDPRTEQEQQRQAESAKRSNTFSTVLDDYLKYHARGLRTGKVIAGELQRECAAWRNTQITSITQRDVKDLILAIARRGNKTQAHVIFGLIRAFFNWVVDSGDYAVEHSPCAKIKAKALAGPKAVGQRVLNDDELQAFWRASQAMEYPFGPFFRALLLTGLRRGEVADAHWSEFDLKKQLWIIPAERMKAKAAHAVPLTSDMMQILDSLPGYGKPGFLFSTTAGRKPISGFSKAKTRLDKLMAKELAGEHKDWNIHDVRRTMRTHLSALPIPDLVRELLLAHTKPGLHRVYDQYAYIEEKRRGLELWGQRLRTILEPAHDNVVSES